ncbi:SirA family protein [Acidihalobacter yilgarnensis]|uniref:SirA family protein n=1 Tax=Acidihalobacter yilgarnensis TaxID=2819280 RepID=A0A1D8IS02_9GAMM|nr:sulfurtransferase TusA family protein [Acidihalobacter yilgarnensis]AOU99259.1 SirA family protein [Acidihalobacter yilgarnensis]
MAEYTLDARRLLCPLPVIRVQTRVAELMPGDTLRVHCTDPGALLDIPAWCRVHGHRVLESHQDAGEVSLVILIQTNEATTR